MATGVLNFLASIAPFFPRFRRRQALVLIEVFAVRDRHSDVKPRQGDPAAPPPPRFPGEVIPAPELVPQRFHKLQGFQVLMVQVWLAKEQQDNVMTRAS